VEQETAVSRHRLAGSHPLLHCATYATPFGGVLGVAQDSGDAVDQGALCDPVWLVAQRWSGASPKEFARGLAGTGPPATARARCLRHLEAAKPRHCETQRAMPCHD
jgi:hypothetical protein